MKAVFTVSSPEYMRRARNALNSFVEHNSDYWDYILTKEDLPRSSGSRWHWAGPGRIEGAIQLLDSGYEEVVYVDADTQTYSKIDLLDFNTSMAITPHFLSPVPNDTQTPSMSHTRLMGVYNSGVFAVDRWAMSFLNWWLKQTLEMGQLDPKAGVAAEQGWLDFAPSFLGDGCRVVVDPGVNMAYWRMHTSKFYRQNTTKEWWVDLRPLKIMHFSGLTEDLDPRRLSIHQNRLVCPPEALPLFEEYKKAVYE